MFAVRLAAGIVSVRRGSFLRYDGRDYDEIARNVAAGRGYLVDHVRWFETARPVPAPDFSRPPLAPLVLAAFYAVLPDSVYVAAVVAAATGALACLLCALLARRLWGDPPPPPLRAAGHKPARAEPRRGGETAFRTALALAGAWPFFIYYSAHLSTEALFTALVAGLLLSLVTLAREAGAPPRRLLGRAAVAGAALGASALCRPTMLVAFAAVPAWVAVSLRCGRRLRAAVACTVLASACLTVAPWTIRNCASSGEFIPVSNLGGYVFWLGNNEASLRAYSAIGYREFLRLRTGTVYELSDRLVADMGTKGALSPRTQERFWSAEGLRFVREHPGGYVFLFFARLGHFLRPWLIPAAHGATPAAASFVLWGTLYAAALAGLVRLWRRERAGALAFLAVTGSGALAHALTFVVLRHRVPFVDTAAICLAAPVLREWIRALRARVAQR